MDGTEKANSGLDKQRKCIWFGKQKEKQPQNYCRRCATKLNRVKMSLDFRTPAPKKRHKYMNYR